MTNKVRETFVAISDVLDEVARIQQANSDLFRTMSEVDDHVIERVRSLEDTIQLILKTQAEILKAIDGTNS